MLVIVHLDRRVDADDHRHLVRCPAAPMDAQRGLLPRAERPLDARDVERLRPVERERLRVRPLLELQREHAHADEIGAMDSLEARHHDRADAQKLRPLRGPVAGASRAVLVTADDDQRRVVLRVSHRRVVDREPLVRWIVHRHSAFDARHHQVLDAHVRERPARHHPVIAAARAVAVEVLDLDAVLLQIPPRRRRRLDRPRGTDVVRRHGVPEDRQRSRAVDVLRRPRLRGELREERRLLDVRRLSIPLVQQSRRRRDVVPQRILVREVRVHPSKVVRLQRIGEHVPHFLERRPDVAEVDVALAAAADRLLGHVDVDPPREREGHDERRRHEEVRADGLVHARLEVAIPAQHRDADEVVLVDGILDQRVERAGVADARRAAISDGVEAEAVEIRLEARLLVVLGDHARARRERCLHDARNAQSLLHGFLREQARGEHHRRIRRVRAGGDRGDEDVAVMQLGDRHREFVRERGRRDAVRRRTVVDHLRLGQLARVARVLRLRHGRRLLPPAPRHLGARARDADHRLDLPLDLRRRLAVAARRLGLEHVRERRLEHVELDAVLRALRSGDRRTDVRQVELKNFRVLDLPLARDPEHPLRLVVGPEPVDVLLGAAGEREVPAGLLVDGEVAHGRAVLGGHVGDGRAVGDRERRRSIAEVLDELADDFRVAQQLGDGENEVGRGHALLQRPGEVHTDHVRREEVDRLPEHARFRLDSADAPGDDPQAVDHRRVGVGADE